MITDTTKEVMLNGYKHSYPFSFAVIDNFLCDEQINKGLEDVKNWKHPKPIINFMNRGGS